MISRGAIRKLTHPFLLRLWKRHAANKVMTTSVGGFQFKVLPSVFHPRYFRSSVILGEYVEAINLRGKTFLDMGTGSGVIGLFAARAGATVTGVDVNPRAIECAAANAVAAGYPIEYLCSDLFSALPARRFDLIAWNPPFFPKPALTPAEAAWCAGADHEVIVRFAKESGPHLSSGGAILLVLSLDIDVAAIARMFEKEGYAVRRAATRRGGGLGETMVVLEIR